MHHYVIINVFVDKNRDMIMVPYKRTKDGYRIAVEPYKRISYTEWPYASKYIVEMVKENAKNPRTNDTKSDVFKQICGNRGWKAFTKRHICIEIQYDIEAEAFLISNHPRALNGGYGAEKGTLSEKYSIDYTGGNDTALIQENFVRACRDAERYLEALGDGSFFKALYEGDQYIEEPKADSGTKGIASGFGYKTAWFAIKDAEMDEILAVCPNLTNVRRTTWECGLEEAQRSDDKAFLSGPYDRWTFLVGLGLPDPSQTEVLISFLEKLGAIAQKVCYFASYRTVSSYAFADVTEGELTRLYAYSGEIGHIYKNVGQKSEAEKKLSLNFPTNDDELFQEGFDEIDEEHILLLAERLSLDPQDLFGREERRCVAADIVPCEAFEHSDLCGKEEAASQKNEKTAKAVHFFRKFFRK